MYKVFVAAGAMLAAVSVAEAAPQCGPGKIYRVTQKVCVEKTAAVREGVYKTREARITASADRKTVSLQQGKAQPVARAKALRAARQDRRASARMARLEAAQERESARERTDDRPGGADAPRRSIILPPVKNVIGAATSPFGALADPWSSDRVNAPQETLFSLRLAVEN